MSLPAQKFREVIVQYLFSFDIGGKNEEMISLMMKEIKTNRKSLMEAYDKSDKIWSCCEEIDQKIQSFSPSYNISRIGIVEKSVLRLALYELFYENVLPLEIIISEAIRLTRKFSSKEGALFVHAIIGAAAKSQVQSSLSPS